MRCRCDRCGVYTLHLKMNEFGNRLCWYCQMNWERGDLDGR